MPRVLVPPSAIRGDVITIADPREVHHLLDVLRVKAGDQLECFDGEGRAYVGTVARAGARQLTVTISETHEGPRPTWAVTLGLSLIRPERFDWALQKVTELGVQRVVPLVTSRTVIRLSPKQAERKLARWRRVVAESAKQCGRSTLPLVEHPQPLDQFLGTLGGEPCVLMPTLAVRAPSLTRLIASLRRPRSVVALIGPEGDFTRDEVVLAERGGVRLVSLGSLTLRSETAAIVIVAILQHRWGAL